MNAPSKKPNPKLSLALAGALAFGFGGIPLMTAPSHVQAEPRIPRGDGEFDVKYDDLPRAVRDSLDQERRDHKVSKVTFVRRNGNEFYRAIVDEKGAEREIRIGVEGKILTEQDQRGERSGREAPARDREAPARDHETAAVARVEEVKFDDCPGDVKGSIGREAGPNKVLSVSRFKRGGAEIYQAEVGNGDRTRTIQCTSDGKIVADFDVTAAGSKQVRYEELPGEVKHAIDREASSDKVLRVIQRTRDHNEVYTAEILDHDGGKRFATVDQSGKVIAAGEETRRGK